MFRNGFERWEFACGCGCGFDTVDVETIFVQEELKRWYCGRVVDVLSGCRCYEYNEKIKRLDPNYKHNTSKSQHVLGRAVDIVVVGIDPSVVYDYLNRLYPGMYGLGNYKTFTHFDTRTITARW
jgi:uncharacterized protein YcbK (DUF882 family)